MSKEELPLYLKDHLAGSVGALELLDHLIETHKGEPLEEFFQNLRDEIDADQETLQELIEKLGEKESAVRKAGAWLAEKLSRAKIRLSDSEKNQLGLLHALEGLVLGIIGKRALWAALAVAADAVPQLREPVLQRRQRLTVLLNPILQFMKISFCLLSGEVRLDDPLGHILAGLNYAPIKFPDEVCARGPPS